MKPPCSSRPLAIAAALFAVYVIWGSTYYAIRVGVHEIPPFLMGGLRMLLIGYLYGITSERKLVEELRMHLAWRWFTGLGFDQELPHHSTFSKNRHGRFQQSKLFEQLFEQIVRQAEFCVPSIPVRWS